MRREVEVEEGSKANVEVIHASEEEQEQKLRRRTKEAKTVGGMQEVPCKNCMMQLAQDWSCKMSFHERGQKMEITWLSVTKLSSEMTT
jgi:hypothetical protein